jgi:hypothetical protein
MAAGTIVIVVESANRVEEEESAKVSETNVQMTSEASFQGGLNPAGESVLLKHRRQLIIQPRVAFSGAVGRPHQEHDQRARRIQQGTN